jgi:hypothetical protein
MRVIIYDMRDAREPGDRLIVLRLIDSTGCLRVQSPIYGTEDFAQNLGEVLAKAFGTELEWLGPSPVASVAFVLQPVRQFEQAVVESAAATSMELSPAMLLLSNQRQLDLF